jgi:NADPH:quinone reductase-like Zn-dependent oxidoreductase
MKAIICTKYGTPDVLEIQNIKKPIAKDNEILIKIHATSITSGDSRIRQANPFMIRLIFGFKKPRQSVLGVIVAGEVEAIGKSVSKFKVGDQIYGSLGMGFGAHAEYATVKEDAILTLKPKNISYEEAAAIPFGATASMHFLRLSKIQPRQNVLIYGASGALGTAAIQLAKINSATVTAVCSSTNFDLVKDLGADLVIDYTKQDPTKTKVKYDVIFETVGKSSFSKNISALNKSGVLLMASANISTMLRGAITSIFSSKTIKTGVIKETIADLNYFTTLIEKNKFKPVIDKVYPLNEFKAAHTHVDIGHKKGNVILSVQYFD